MSHSASESLPPDTATSTRSSRREHVEVLDGLAHLLAAVARGSAPRRSWRCGGGTSMTAGPRHTRHFTRHLPEMTGRISTSSASASSASPGTRVSLRMTSTDSRLMSSVRQQRRHAHGPRSPRVRRRVPERDLHGRSLSASSRRSVGSRVVAGDERACSPGLSSSRRTRPRRLPAGRAAASSRSRERAAAQSTVQPPGPAERAAAASRAGGGTVSIRPGGSRRRSCACFPLRRPSRYAPATTTVSGDDARGEHVGLAGVADVVDLAAGARGASTRCRRG